MASKESHWQSVISATKFKAAIYSVPKDEALEIPKKNIKKNKILSTSSTELYRIY